MAGKDVNLAKVNAEPKDGIDPGGRYGSRQAVHSPHAPFRNFQNTIQWTDAMTKQLEFSLAMEWKKIDSWIVWLISYKTSIPKDVVGQIIELNGYTVTLNDAGESLQKQTNSINFSKQVKQKVFLHFRIQGLPLSIKVVRV